jgi:hypothetical protein
VVVTDVSEERLPRDSHFPGAKTIVLVQLRSVTHVAPVAGLS